MGDDDNDTGRNNSLLCFKFNCDYCGFSTDKKSTIMNHNKSKKHLVNTNQADPNEIYVKRKPKDKKNTEPKKIIHECQQCFKIYKTQSGLWKHENNGKSCFVDKPIILKLIQDCYKEKSKRTIIKIANDESKKLTDKKEKTISKIETDVSEISRGKTLNYIYLLREREFEKTGENIYKIGRTKKENFQRFNQYPKGSVLLFHMICSNCEQIESNLIQLFREHFRQCKEIGTEYFEGDCFAMIDLIYKEIVNEREIINEQKTNPEC
jgi:hypothetical protein